MFRQIMFRKFDESDGKRIIRISEELDKNMEPIYSDSGRRKILDQENSLADLIKSYLERPKKPNQNLIEKLFVSAFTRSNNRGDRVEDNPVIKLIIDKINIDISVDSHPGEKLIHLASRLGKTKIVEALLKKGANINEKTIEGKTPLHIALENYHEYKDDIFSYNKSSQLEFIDFLIENGSDLEITRPDGLNARDIIENQKRAGIFSDDKIKSLPNLLMAMNLQSEINGVSALAVDSGAMNSIEGAKVKQEPVLGGVEVKQEAGVGEEPYDGSKKLKPNSEVTIGVVNNSSSRAKLSKPESKGSEGRP
jgi:hypothetical protein